MSSSNGNKGADDYEDYQPNFSDEPQQSHPSGYLASQTGQLGTASDLSGKTSNGGVQTHQPVRRPDLHLTEAQPNTEHHEADAGWYGSMIHSLGQCVGTLGAIPCCVCFPSSYRRVEQGSVGLITKFGRYQRMLPAGLAKVNPLSERLYTVDVKITTLEIGTQTCITKDNVNLQLSSVIYYHIIAPERAAFSVQNVRTALSERTQTTLRHVVGSRVLQDLIERREEVAASIREIIDEVVESWGVKVESILVRDLVFSRELQESLSMAAQAKRIGESKVIAAAAEVRAAQLMRKTADLLSSPAAMSIRMYEAQQAMAKTANTKIIFLPGSPFPGGKMNGNFGPSGPMSGSSATVQEADNDNSTEMSNLVSKTVMENM